jgi:radical SAM protein with 4Fe4S-binding SPASM domain
MKMAKDRPPCAGLWNTPMIHVNGEVTTCCLDEHLENTIGNITEHSLDQLWNGAKMNRWRKAHIAGKFEASGPLCTRCNWRSAGGYPAEKADQWLLKHRKGKMDG